MSELPPDPAAKGCFYGGVIGAFVVPLVWLIALYTDGGPSPSPLLGLIGVAFVSVLAAIILAAIGYFIGGAMSSRREGRKP
jgi:hypothetical protein